MSMRCPVHFVLHEGEEILRRHCLAIIVYACCVYISDLLIKKPLARADVADALQKLVEIVFADRSSCFDSLIVESKTFY